MVPRPSSRWAWTLKAHAEIFPWPNYIFLSAVTGYGKRCWQLLVSNSSMNIHKFIDNYIA